ncbi:MAG: ATP-dependent protease ATPase subunit HslU [Clostridia bacterium]
MEMTPKQIVAELDKYIVGQTEAKKAVAIALRNRYRRSMLSAIDREEITPKNIIMKGPTGVGKTEIARRLAKLVKAPFIKVEATKYTEVGYVGRDVESMVRDLVECSIRLVKEERIKDVQDKAYSRAVNIITEILQKNTEILPQGVQKETIKDEILNHNLDMLVVEIQVPDEPKPIEVAPGAGSISLGSIFGNVLPKKTKPRKMVVRAAIEMLTRLEADKLIDEDNVSAEALRRAEEEGIIFIDEIDKIAGKGNANGPDVSREGVQRDILPIVEGSSVSTKYGIIKTDYILFIASGAFHVSKVSDLIPELQGRFPVVVELTSLNKADFVRILTEPENSITGQYKKLLEVDNINLTFTTDGIDEIADVAVELNTTSEDIGARRLQSIMEHIVEEVSFEIVENGIKSNIIINKEFVANNIVKESRAYNLKRYIL